jgi:hypothetical protein
MATRGRGQSNGSGGGVWLNPNLSQPLQPPTGLQPAQIPSPCNLPVKEPVGPTRVLLRRVFFLSHVKNIYVSVGFYPAPNYTFMVEFGGPRIITISLTEQQRKTLRDKLPKLSDSLCRNETFTCTDELFRLQTTATLGVEKMYLGRSFINFSLHELRNHMDV